MTELDLPDAELDVMSCLWRTDAMTAREVREQPSMCGLKLRQLMSSVERQPDWSPIVHQRFDRTKAVDFVHDLANHRLTVIGRQVDRLLSAEVCRETAQL